MGFDDEFGDIKIIVPGGKVRANTQAIVPMCETDDSLQDICNLNGQYDIAFVGANGVSVESGITTHDNVEVANKIEALKLSKKRIIICDDSKWGISLNVKIADWKDDLTVIVNKNENNQSLLNALTLFSDKIELA